MGNPDSGSGTACGCDDARTRGIGNARIREHEAMRAPAPRTRQGDELQAVSAERVVVDLEAAVEFLLIGRAKELKCAHGTTPARHPLLKRNAAQARSQCDEES